jgi:hypothetical protein
MLEKSKKHEKNESRFLLISTAIMAPAWRQIGK